MKSYRKTAIIVGVLFIIATGIILLSAPFTQYIHTTDYLTDISANSTQVTIGALFEIIMGLAIASIATTIYPMLKKYNESLALGYVGVRIIEGTIYIVVAVFSLLSLVTLSQEFVTAGSPVASYFQTLGALLVSAHEWTFAIGGGVVFTISALILNYILYKSRLVPRFISVWGIIGAALLLGGGLLTILDFISETSVLASLIFIPIALQEMVFAIWLIVKGFNLSAITSMTAKTEIS